jgi:hypothetical protein
LRRSAKIAAMVLLPMALSACAASDDGKPITFTDDRGVSNQPFPNNFRTEVLAFLKTYLNNPVGVRDAVVAEPVQRVIGGRLRYVVCLRFSPRESPFSSSTAGSTASSKTPASPVPAPPMRHSRNWRN